MGDASVEYLGRLGLYAWMVAIGVTLQVMLFIGMGLSIRLSSLPLAILLIGVLVSGGSAWATWVVCSPRPVDPAAPGDRDGRLLRWLAAMPLVGGALGFAVLASVQSPLTSAGALVVAGSGFAVPFFVGVFLVVLSLATLVPISIRGWVLSEWGTDTALASWFKVLPFVVLGALLAFIPTIAIGPMMVQGFLSFLAGTASALVGLAGIGIMGFTLVRLAVLCTWAKANRGVGLERDRRLGARIADRVIQNAAKPENVAGRVTQPLARPSPQGNVLLASSTSEGYDLVPSPKSVDAPQDQPRSAGS